MLGFLLLRFLAFLLVWVCGYEFWFLPNLFDESLSFVDSFKPVCVYVCVCVCLCVCMCISVYVERERRKGKRRQEEGGTIYSTILFTHIHS